jgi:hypothetical protein
MISLISAQEKFGMAGTPGDGITAHLPGGKCATGHPTTPIAPLNASRTAQRAVPTKNGGGGTMPYDLAY